MSQEQAMSHTIPREPAMVLRSSYAQVRALLLVAVAAIVGLTIAVVLVATNNGSSTAGTPAIRANSTVNSANALASEDLGAKLDHSGRNTSAVLASSQRVSAVAISANAIASQELGAKLDHSGRSVSGGRWSNSAAIRANAIASQELGAKLDHSGRSLPN